MSRLRPILALFSPLRGSLAVFMPKGRVDSPPVKHACGGLAWGFFHASLPRGERPRRACGAFLGGSKS